MINTTQSLLLILVMALVTIALRFLPFLLFPSGDKIPAPMLYLSKVLPCAVMGMLVVYCLKNVNTAHLALCSTRSPRHYFYRALADLEA
jgi:branched-subunit amino acid transport protein AzlD